MVVGAGAWAFEQAGGARRVAAKASAAIRDGRVDSDISVLHGGGDVG
jgi:hypothetical protein